MQETINKILVISSCTGKKDYNGNIPKPTSICDLRNAINNRTFADFVKTAENMYLGKAHKSIKTAICSLITKGINVDWKIISAGYGLLDPQDHIIPYEITFRNKNKKEIEAMSDKLEIPKDVNDLIKDYDCIIFALAPEYLAAIQIEKITNFIGKTVIVIESNSSQRKNERFINKLCENNSCAKWMIQDPCIHGGNIPFRGVILEEISEKVSNTSDFYAYLTDKEL